MTPIEEIARAREDVRLTYPGFDPHSVIYFGPDLIRAESDSHFVHIARSPLRVGDLVEKTK